MEGLSIREIVETSGCPLRIEDIYPQYPTRPRTLEESYPKHYICPSGTSEDEVREYDDALARGDAPALHLMQMRAFGRNILATANR